MKSLIFKLAFFTFIACLFFSDAGTRTRAFSERASNFSLPAPAAAAVRNGKIAFISYRTENAEIFTMTSNGTNQVNLTNTPVSEGSPSLSRDGKKIAFGKYDSNVGRFDIYTMNADGSNLTRLFYDDPDGRSINPNWSHDGTKIVFSTNTGGIGTMEANGANWRMLPIFGGFNNLPEFSPDGSRIVYYCERSINGNPPGSDNAEICMANADGTNEILLTRTLQATESHPTFSPDGTKIAYTRRINADNSAQIYVMNADGSNPVNLTGVSGGAAPAWSPDGTKIAFQSSRDGNSEIYVMNADGTNQTRLINNPAFDQSPTWGRAEPRAAFDFDGDAKSDISVIRPLTGDWHLLRSASEDWLPVHFGAPGDKPAPADYDGDGKTDIAIFRDGTWYLQRSQQGYYVKPFGAPNDRPVPAAFVP